VASELYDEGYGDIDEVPRVDGLCCWVSYGCKGASKPRRDEVCTISPIPAAGRVASDTRTISSSTCLSTKGKLVLPIPSKSVLTTRGSGGLTPPGDALGRGATGRLRRSVGRSCDCSRFQAWYPGSQGSLLQSLHDTLRTLHLSHVRPAFRTNAALALCTSFIGPCRPPLAPGFLVAILLVA